MSAARLKHVCAKCGHVEVRWDEAPGLFATLQFVQKRGAKGTTAGEISERFDISLSNACNRALKLEELGEIRHTTAINPGGGTIRTYRPTEPRP